MATVVWMLAASLRVMAQEAGVPTEIEAGAPTAIVAQTTARSPLTLSAMSLAMGRQLSPPPPTPSVRPARATISKRKAALIGACGGSASCGFADPFQPDPGPPAHVRALLRCGAEHRQSRGNPDRRLPPAWMSATAAPEKPVPQRNNDP